MEIDRYFEQNPLGFRSTVVPLLKTCLGTTCGNIKPVSSSAQVNRDKEEGIQL
jgi:hypothetical protein